MSHPPDDDEPEIEVAPLRAPIVRKPRVTNPEVDNVIQSGEIAPRSLVIRSQSQPSMPVMASPIALPPPPPPRRLGWLWLVAATVPALAVVGLTLAKPMTAPVAQPTTDLEAVAELIGTTFDGEARAVQVRAEAIASSSMLRAGIETDPQTLDDMSRDKDVVFPIAKGEALEVIQLRDGARTSMLRLPKDAAPILAPPQGTARLEARGPTPSVVVDAPVTTQAGAVGGEVVLAVPLDLARIKNHLPKRASAFAVTGFSALIPLDDVRVAPGETLSFPIHTSVPTPAPLAMTTVVAAAPPVGQPTWFRVARGVGAGLVALFVILYLASLLMRRSRG